MNLDPDGNERTIPVKMDGKHRGLIVWHSPQEYERLWAGVDRDVIEAMQDPEWKVQDGC